MGYVKWLGHAAFEIELDGKIVYIDPWITNPRSPIKLEDIKSADYVVVTHDHGDHLGEAFEITRKTGAFIVGIYELSLMAKENGIDRVICGNIGGPMRTKDLEFILTPAFHSGEKLQPTGIVIRGEESTIYHAGDTGLFSDMRLIGELYKPNIALLPIGGYFTMGPREAAKAVEFLKPDVVIPMHYGTFPIISGDPNEFSKLAGEYSKVVILKPGEKYEI